MKKQDENLISVTHTNKDGSQSIWFYKKETPYRFPVMVEHIYTKEQIKEQNDIYNKEKNDLKKPIKKNKTNSTRTTSKRGRKTSK